MYILIWIVFGALVGWVASKVMGTGQGLVMDIIVGIVGAILGGWLMRNFGGAGVSGFNLYSFLVALLGAVVLLVILKLLRRV